MFDPLEIHPSPCTCVVYQMWSFSVERYDRNYEISREILTPCASPFKVTVTDTDSPGTYDSYNPIGHYIVNCTKSIYILYRPML